MTKRENAPVDGAIAIVGMAGCFPGASDVPALWDNLLKGREAVRRLPEEELRAAGVPDDLMSNPAYVPYAAPIDDPYHFDAGFFGMTPQEARITDPQQRLFLECAWRALEDAGAAPGSRNGARVGVFAGMSMSTYLLSTILRNQEFAAADLPYAVLIGNDKDFLASRVAYKLGLTGPSQSVQTACSSSMTALHLARRSLLDGECDLAVVGGASVTFPQAAGYLYQEGGIQSPDGHCRAFDTEAAGTIKGNGCGVVVLRRLADAEAARDRVYAVLRGSAVNNDGSARMGFTSPSVGGQAEVITQALRSAGVPAADVGYVEAHGTGTRLGDPIEIRALVRAHSADGRPPAHCALGSVKANIGHLDAAAGVVGVIKAALVLYHQVIPPQINFATVNPELELDSTRYRIHAQAHLPEEPIRAAGVSSFGLGGTNGHCVLTPHTPATVGRTPDITASGDAQQTYPVLLSARDDTALAKSVQDLRQHLELHPDTAISDLAYTLWVGRARFPRRWVATVRSIDELRDALDAFPAQQSTRAVDSTSRGGAVPDDTEAMAAFAGTAGIAKVSLPGYPFRREPYLVEADSSPGAPVPERTGPATSHGWPAALDTVLEAWRRALGIADVGADDDYYTLGGDSLSAVEIVTALREKLGIDLGLDEFEGLRTPARIADRILQVAPDTRPPRDVVSRIKDGAGPGLFLVHPAGGTNFGYYELVQHLREDGPVYVFSFPMERAEEFRTIRELAALYLGAILDVQPTGPYRLGGYSFGGNTALEIALMLQRRGERVEQLIMFDSHPPEAYLGPRVSEQDFLAAFPMLMEPVFGAPAPDTAIRPPADVDEALAMVRQPTWTDATVEEIRRFFEIWHRNHDALKGHYPEQPFTGDVTIFQASEPESTEILTTLGITPLGKEQWKEHITGELRLIPVPGDHYTMFSRRENVRRVGEIWNEVLAQVGEEKSA
ncbi:beta-ketoacyl synthase N-terminal-like domain-containing protein [Streptomyces arenae]|uniref:beta-ketoacyl synthase N-terminal-like domain-containing protein n=1 Tax=Streptomyces arenae TaxID=29301 RepID=UPI002657C5F3|nr:beta-ketoacyl synthase N-terminal-like domain-containing protein [Streptomyces arenae]MCG7210090.1 thioesterase domain-containing protein [Streptomyces arenae]